MFKTEGLIIEDDLNLTCGILAQDPWRSFHRNVGWLPGQKKLLEDIVSDWNAFFNAWNQDRAGRDLCHLTRLQDLDLGLAEGG